MFMAARTALMRGRVSEAAATLYDSYVVAATNKTLWLRASSIAQADNTSVTTWDDEASANNFTNSGTAPTLQTLELNGQSCVRFNDNLMVSSTTLTTILGGNVDRTVFIVARASGAQTDVDISPPSPSGYLAPGLISDSGGYWGMHFDVRQFVVNNYNDDSDNSGINYSDNTAFVWGHRVNSSGNVRRNITGSVTTATPAWGAPDTLTGTLRLGHNYDAEHVVMDLFEILICSDEKSDTDMDNIVVGLREKYGL